MANPWTKKNPYLSMWLSGANAFLGASRGRAAAAQQRQMQMLTTQMTKDFMSLWTLPTAWTAAPPAKRKRSKKPQR